MIIIRIQSSTRKKESLLIDQLKQVTGIGVFCIINSTKLDKIIIGIITTKKKSGISFRIIKLDSKNARKKNMTAAKMTLKIKPNIIMKDMQKHPELINPHVLRNYSLYKSKIANPRKINANSSMHSKPLADPMATKTYQNMDKTRNKLNASQRYELDKKIDPQKPILLDIMISEPRRKFVNSTKHSKLRSNVSPQIYILGS